MKIESSRQTFIEQTNERTLAFTKQHYFQSCDENIDNRGSEEDKIKNLSGLITQTKVTNGKRLKSLRFKILKSIVYVLNPIAYVAFATLFLIITGTITT